MKKENALLLITQANNSIEQAINFLKENKEAFYFMNLKLYDASFYCGSDKMKEEFPLCYEYPHSYVYTNDLSVYNFFYDFCDLKYDMFVDDLKNTYNIDFCSMQHFINNTSSFYLHSGNIVDVNSYGIDYDYSIENFINEGYDFPSFSIENGKIKINLEDYSEEDLEYELEAIRFVKEDIVKFVKDYSEDILIVYRELKNFKDNQVELFKDYLKEEEECIKEELEEKARKRKEAQDKINSLVTKYSIEENDLKELVDNYNVANSK